MLGTQLLKVIQESAKPSSSETTEMLLGVVTSTSPLVIRVDNRYDLTEDFLLLTTLVQDFDVDMTVNHLTEVDSHAPHTHGYVGRKTFRVHWGLQTGEKVFLIRVQNGQKFIILDRVR